MLKIVRPTSWQIFHIFVKQTATRMKGVPYRLPQYTLHDEAHLLKRCSINGSTHSLRRRATVSTQSKLFCLFFLPITMTKVW